MKIRAYILAGGKSSRMGRDKAMLELGDMTLLARAVKMLRSVSRLQSAGGKVIVTVTGKREALEGADRFIVDRYPECGPLGGIEAALDDVARGGEVDWAFLIPVDMPLLQVDLIDQMLATWTGVIELDSSIHACLAEVKGKPQPLVSLVHRNVLAAARAALDTGSYKVIPVLKSAGLCCTSLSQEDSSSGERKHECSASRSSATAENSQAKTTAPEGPSRGDYCAWDTAVQFTNVNTEADLIEVATLMKLRG